MPPIQGEPLLLYLSVTDNTMGAMLAQHLPGTKTERAIYYLSKKIAIYEEKYTHIEKVCIALVWACQKLRHYFVAAEVWVIAKDNPLRYLLEKPNVIGKTARWMAILSEVALKFVAQKSIKWSVIAEHLAACPPKEG